MTESKHQDVYISLPPTGKQTIGIGDTEIDYTLGQAILPDGTVVPTSGSIRKGGIELKSIYIDTDQNINILVYEGSRRKYTGFVPIGAFKIPNISFDLIRITTTTSTILTVVASSNPLPVSTEAGSGGGGGGGVISIVGDGRQVVAAAGTRVALAGSTVIKQVVITAETDNTDIVVVGGSTVVAALATRRGTPLFPGDSVVLDGDNLADFYIDSLVNGEGVTYTYLA